MSEILKGLKRFEKDVKLARRIEVLMLDWHRSYPHVDLRSQIQWAHSWLECNPKRIKKDYIRFLNNWMKGEERRIGERRSPIALPHQKYQESKPEGEVMEAQDFLEMRKLL